MAQCSFEGSSGSAAAVAMGELLEGASFGPKVPQEEVVSGNFVSARTMRKRRIAGIFQHYYPEGGWGYVILLVGFFVQVLAIGLQQSVAILIFPLSSRRYQVADNGYIGKNKRHLYDYLMTLYRLISKAQSRNEGLILFIEMCLLQHYYFFNRESLGAFSPFLTKISCTNTVENSKINVPASAVHILKLERYRED